MYDLTEWHKRDNREDEEDWVGKEISELRAYWEECIHDFDSRLSRFEVYHCRPFYRTSLLSQLRLFLERIEGIAFDGELVFEFEDSRNLDCLIDFSLERKPNLVFSLGDYDFFDYFIDFGEMFIHHNIREPKLSYAFLRDLNPENSLLIYSKGSPYMEQERARRLIKKLNNA